MIKRRGMFAVAVLGLLIAGSVAADDWPQWRGTHRDGTWAEDGLLKKFPESLEPEWTVELGSGYSGPTVSDRRVYVTDRTQRTERVHCFDSKSGNNLWTHEYPAQYTVSYKAGPRASVTIDDGRAYALGAMGHLHCLDAGSGAVLWEKDLQKVYQIRMPTWGIAAAPLIYDDLVILQIGGANGACMIGLDKKSGDEEWRALNDRASYSSPILTRQAGKDVCVCWTGDSVAGLNPETGDVYWRFPFPPRGRGPIGIATPILQGDRLFVTSFYEGSLMLRLPPNALTVEKVWQRAGGSEQDTDALHSIISTPVWIGDHIYGVDSYGEFRCLEAKTGDRVWEDQTATPKARWSTIHFVQNGKTTWMLNERGDLIIARLSPSGFQEISRVNIIEPTTKQLPRRGGVCWSHPAYADKHIFMRNDNKLICVSLEED